MGRRCDVLIFRVRPGLHFVFRQPVFFPGRFVAVLEHPTAPNSKTGIVSPAIIPALAIVDPTVTHTLPRNVLAGMSSGVPKCVCVCVWGCVCV